MAAFSYYAGFTTFLLGQIRAIKLVSSSIYIINNKIIVIFLHKKYSINKSKKELFDVLSKHTNEFTWQYILYSIVFDQNDRHLVASCKSNYECKSMLFLSNKTKFIDFNENIRLLILWIERWSFGGSPRPRLLR